MSGCILHPISFGVRDIAYPGLFDSLFFCDVSGKLCGEISRQKGQQQKQQQSSVSNVSVLARADAATAETRSDRGYWCSNL